jgi:hypothetical protein
MHAAIVASWAASVAGVHVTGIASAQEQDPRPICNLHAWLLRGTRANCCRLLVMHSRGHRLTVTITVMVAEPQ